MVIWFHPDSRAPNGLQPKSATNTYITSFTTPPSQLPRITPKHPARFHPAIIKHANPLQTQNPTLSIPQRPQVGVLQLPVPARLGSHSTPIPIPITLVSCKSNSSEVCRVTQHQPRSALQRGMQCHRGRKAGSYRCSHRKEPAKADTRPTDLPHRIQTTAILYILSILSKPSILCDLCGLCGQQSCQSYQSCPKPSILKVLCGYTSTFRLLCSVFCVLYSPLPSARKTQTSLPAPHPAIFSPTSNHYS